MYKFQMQPATPDIARYRADAQRILDADASLFGNIHDDTPAPHEAVCELDGDADVSIEQGDRVSVFPAGAWEPRVGVVLAVRSDGLYLVQMQFGAKKWWFERDLTLLVKAAALEAEATSA